MITEFCLVIVLAILTNVLSGTFICPLNETSWNERAMKLCNGSNFVYHCLPTIYLNASKESCKQKETIQADHCAVYDTVTEKVTFDSTYLCSGNGYQTGCPEQPYWSDESYLYPSCLQINPDKACYLANSSCPNITGSTSSPGSSSSNARQLSPPYLLQCVQYVFTKALFFLI